MTPSFGSSPSENPEDGSFNVSMAGHELVRDCPSVMRSVLELTEGVEAGPATEHDCVRSIDILVAAMEKGPVLLSSQSWVETSDTARLERIDSVVRALNEQLDGLSKGSAPLSPKELIEHLHALIFVVALPEVATSETAAARADIVVRNFNVLQDRIRELEPKIFRARSTVLKNEAISLRELAPEDPGTHFQLGDGLAREGRFADALPSFQRAHELSPNEGSFAFCLAKCLKDLGRFPEALEIALKAVALSPKNEAVLGITGEIYQALGDVSNAVHFHLRSVTANPYSIAIPSDRALQKFSADPSVELPRPPNFRVPDYDQRLAYRGNGRHESECRIRVFVREENPVVLLTWDDKSSGTSITNAAEVIANDVCAQFKLDASKAIFIEHYEMGMCGPHSITRCVLSTDAGGVLKDPRWLGITYPEFEQLTGYRLTWRPNRLSESRPSPH